MAAVSTSQLLIEIHHLCHRSALVNHIEERILDIDVLHVRAHLTVADTFINVFFNLATDKVAFALIQSGRRIYGADNAKQGWHYHPFIDPDQHIVCAPVTFAEFLGKVEIHFAK